MHGPYDLGEDDREPNDPTLAKIAAVYERIQTTWTTKQRDKRRVTALEDVVARRVVMGVASGYGITRPV